MLRYGSRFLRVPVPRLFAVTLAAALAACSLRTGPTSRPTTAEVRIEGSSPNSLWLITSTDFYEQLNTSTLERTPVPITADTIEITLPYSATLDMGPLSSIYVRLYQPDVTTASVRLRVNLDNGEGYDQSASLTDKASLVYYFVYDELVL